MPQKMTAEQRTKIIAWLAINRDHVTQKTAIQVLEKVRKCLGYELHRTSTATISRFAADLGIELKPYRASRGQMTKMAKSDKAAENIVAIARVLLSVVRELGIDPHPDLLRIAGRAGDRVNASPEVAEPVNPHRNGNGQLFKPEASE